MVRAEATVDVLASPARVWSALVDWESQSQWMKDAEWVRVLTPHRQGLGVIVRARTRIAGGLRVDDDMIVTDWREPERIVVRHLGRIIRGAGAFELVPAGADRTRFTWWEDIDLPFGRVGEAVGRALIAPYVSHVFRASLRALKRAAEAG